jgi:S1-C subfamily serine protease
LEARSTQPPRHPTITAGTPTIKGFTAYERAALRIRNIGCGGVSSGSGFAIKDRVLVTNRHVVQGASVLQVETYDGRSRDVQTAGAVAFADLAVVFLQGDLPATLPLADRNPAVGDRITVVGYPLGGQLTTSEGHVLGYGADPIGASDEPMIRNDAPIAPGSSGSPLVDAAGKVVGVAYAGSPGGPFWAVPIELLLSISHGKQAVQPVPECE